MPTLLGGQPVEKDARADDRHALVGPKLPKLAVPCHQIPCPSRERGREDHIIFRVACHAVNFDCWRDDDGIPSQAIEEPDHLLRREAGEEVALLKRPFQLGENVIGHDERNPSNPPSVEYPSRGAGAADEARGEDIGVVHRDGHRR